MRERLARSKKPAEFPDLSFRRVTTDEHNGMYTAKLMEEVGEFLYAYFTPDVEFGNELEEAADVVQVMLDMMGATFDELALAIIRKWDKLGGFDGTVYTEYPERTGGFDEVPD